MTRASKKSRDELAKRLMDVLIARLDAPVSLVVPEETLESFEFNEDWTLFRELQPELFEGKPDPASIERLKATVSGTKHVTIRIPNRVLQVFRQQADKKAVPYQTLMNRALSEAADAFT